MNKVKLIKILEEQKRNLVELVEVSSRKQKAIVVNNRLALEELNHKEEIVLNKLERKEVERINQILILSNETGLDIQEVNVKTIKDFYKVLRANSSTEVYEQIESLRDETKKLITEAGMINKQNNLLVNQAGSLIKQMVSVLFKSQNKPLLDRKA